MTAELTLRVSIFLALAGVMIFIGVELSEIVSKVAAVMQ